VRAIEKLLTFIHVKNQLGMYVLTSSFQKSVTALDSLCMKNSWVVSSDNSGVYIIVYAMELREEFSLYANVSTLASPTRISSPGPIHENMCA
jgi:hypothetical protein